MSYTEFVVACMFQVKRFYCEADYRAASSAVLSHTGGFRVGGGVTVTHSSADWWDLRRDQRLLVSHPKDTGKDSPGISAYPRGGGGG